MTTGEEKSSNESDLYSQISNVIKGGGESFWRNCGAASVGEYE